MRQFLHYLAQVGSSQLLDKNQQRTCCYIVSAASAPYSPFNDDCNLRKCCKKSSLGSALDESFQKHLRFHRGPVEQGGYCGFNWKLRVVRVINLILILSCYWPLPPLVWESALPQPLLLAFSSALSPTSRRTLGTLPLKLQSGSTSSQDHTLERWRPMQPKTLTVTTRWFKTCNYCE